MKSEQPEPIAVVGSGCRFPGGAHSPSQLWELLKHPRDVLQEIPSERFNTTGFHHPKSINSTTNVRHAYLLEYDLHLFDEQFFFISPNEADTMDPQQRLLLETVYEALEEGEHSLKSLRGSDTAVYVGTMSVDWNDMAIRDLDNIQRYYATGTNRAIISNRLSYFFDWHGPSMTIDTACSSSLVAVHQAVQALRAGDSRVAVACGTQIILGPEMFVMESKMKMLSPEGRSRMWDASANGYARGEGVAAIVMKRLSDAIADGDEVQCVILETGTNQDGNSNGLTVPSSESQANLIRTTYTKAGLDLNRSGDRPQYFEAHGTGTQAGDPKEAAAIFQCFGSRASNQEYRTPLYVGSIKTVIGHTEGAAGLAGLLKVIGCVQNGFITPNLLFERLNPAIEPFYNGLEIPTSLMKWPELPHGVPRRASVNSFGFGGSNAHAILEQFVAAPKVSQNLSHEITATVLTPPIFSAASEFSLVSLLEKYSAHLKARPEVHLGDLAWTLDTRRTHFAVKAAFTASSVNELTAKIDERLAVSRQCGVLGIRSIPSSTKGSILGVFTGQGAQWAAMGANLILASPGFVGKRIQELEQALSTLPISDRPRWSLRLEMLAGADVSGIAQAAVSQPLCTAIQIILVDLLRIAGVSFGAVVGHSSGEIAAAYAAGHLSACDAMRVAYYRGLYAHLASGVSDNNAGSAKIAGAMLAVGTSIEDAQELVGLSAFRGRLFVAAHNSSASVTLSGDAQVVLHAKKVFDEEKKFARLLRVDTAYHSHHMTPCIDLYISALQACNIKIFPKESQECVWFSSVVPEAGGTFLGEELRDVYWSKNMTNTVLFADAIQNALRGNPEINLVLEVGPHPALKGPVTQNIDDIRSVALPYHGTLSRGQNDVEALADALGFVWTQLGAHSINFEAYRETVSVVPGDVKLPKPKLVTGLPSYQWNHLRRHWHESRRSLRLRDRKQPLHELLGHLLPESTPMDMRWKNVIRLSQVPWLEGHQIQGQTVFPAAGYVAMALEAARMCVMERKTTIQLLELRDFTISKAIPFDEGNDSGVETLVTFTEVSSARADTLVAKFTCYSCAVSNSRSGQHDVELTASGTVDIILGPPEATALSLPLAPDTSSMHDVDVDRFYSSLSKIGYNYSGDFRTMSSMKRRLNQSSALISTYSYDEEDSTAYLIHPSMLDVAFQVTILAYSAPGDGRLWSLHLPTAIGRVRVNPYQCTALPCSKSNISVLCTVTGGNGPKDPFSGNIDILNDCSKISGCMIQVEDIVMRPFAPATAADDRALFSSIRWQVATPDGDLAVDGLTPSGRDVDIACICERVSLYYLRKWKEELGEEDWANAQPHFQSLYGYVNLTLDEVLGKHHAYNKSEWSVDTDADIVGFLHKYSDVVDLQLISAVGKHMVAAIQGRTTIIEHMAADNMLDNYYEHGHDFAPMNAASAAMVNQIVHRYPHVRILEIGAGTGGATKTILAAVRRTLSSYTYTDISSGFFSKASATFEDYSDRMIFKALDIERPPADQGFQLHSYEIIIANNVLHATRVLKTTLENVRQLLKPGGWLVLAEMSDKGPMRFGTIMGGLPGWWLGANDGRKHTPLLSPPEWHAVLRKAGFSGIDAVTPKLDAHATWPWSIIAAQAVDDRIRLLRQPLSTIKTLNMYHESIVIMGTGSLETSRIAGELAGHLSRFSRSITILAQLPTEIEARNLDKMSSFINLVDIDQPIFECITVERMEGLKRVFELARSVLWITNGAVSADNPYHMASTAFRRVMIDEAPHLLLHNLDATNLLLDRNVSKTIAEHFLRQTLLDEWEREIPSTAKISARPYLWSIEPEAFLDKRGRLLVPRLIHNASQNARLNSSRRVIVSAKAENELGDVAVVLCDNATPTLVEQSFPTKDVAPVKVQVTASSLMAISVAGEAYLFLGLCRNVEQTGDVIFMAETNSNIATPVVSVPVPENEFDSVGILVTVASELLAGSIIQALPSASNIIVEFSSPEKGRLLAGALLREAKREGMRFAFVAGSSAANHQATPQILGPDWIMLDKGASTITLKNALPFTATHYVDLTAADDDVSGTLRLLPAHTKRISIQDLASLKSQPFHFSKSEAVLACLQNAIFTATTSCSPPPVCDVVVSIENVGHGREASIFDIIHWSPSSSKRVPVEIRPLDASRLFSANKTYVLFGLTGDIGQSMCKWMVDNGATSVCLASRTPKAKESWLNSFKDTGISVKLYTVDVADKDGLAHTINDIRRNCPPIAGVVNGAMVLRDCLFSNLSIEMMHAVLRPKIDGSNNLDDLFRNDPLDFFLLLSSSTALIGNPGQSSYVITSGYLNGLVRQRRRRGFAASTIEIGQVIGLGYVESAGDHVRKQLNNYRLLLLNETELQQAFAEAILAGYPTTSDSFEKDGISFPDAVVTTGLGYIRDDDDLVRGPYFKNPLFAHCLISTNGVTPGVPKLSSKYINKIPIMDQLLSAESDAHALTLLRESFATQLCLMLQLAIDTPYHDTPLVELGMDSLVAVESRSWFLKNVKVDIPVLKIIGGSSLSTICEFALEKLSKDRDTAIKVDHPIPTQSVALKTRAQTLTSSSNTSSLTRRSIDGSKMDKPAIMAASATNIQLDVEMKTATNAAELRNVSEKSPRNFVRSGPISIAQSRFWFLRLLIEDPTAFNMSVRYRLTGHVRVGDLERALRTVINRHDALRTCFIGDENSIDQTTQNILARSPIRLEHFEIQSREEAVAEYDKLREHEFDLESGSLFRMVLLTLSSTTHYLLFSAHHIIMDMTSYQTILADMEKAYNGEILSPQPRQYLDFSVTQRQIINDGHFWKELGYWRSIFPLDDPPPVLPLLPMARSSSRTKIAKYELHHASIHVTTALAMRVKEVAKTNHSTPFHVYLAAFKVLLFSFTDVHDLTIGIADANRNNSDLIGSVGLFMNLLTLRFRRQPDQTFEDAIVEARNAAYTALDNSRVPFDVLLKELRVIRSSSYNPFFQAFFDYRQVDRDRQRTWVQCQFDIEDYHPGRSGYDISVDVADLGPEIQVSLRTQKSFYDVTATNLLLQTYSHLIDVLSSDTSLSLRGTPLFSEKQILRSLTVGHGPELCSDWPATLVHRIDLVAVDNADKIALMDGLGNSLSYQAMSNRIESIAEALLKNGVGSACHVLVFQQASTDWICSMLAIMRIGAVYVPLDIRHSLPRLVTLANHCKPSAILADATTIGDAPMLGIPVIIDVTEVATAPASFVPNNARSESPAAILYTSGSIGAPKGIFLQHFGIQNEIEGYTKTYDIGAERVLQQSAFTFDHSVEQIFTGLANGGSVYVVPYSQRGDPVTITEIILQQAITYTKVTPSEYSTWIEFGADNLRRATSWRFAFAGGESLTNHVLQQFAGLGLDELCLYNSYGPAEISIASHKIHINLRKGQLDHETPVSCGFSLPNYATYILDDDLRLLPVGMPGEVVVGGAGVALGYLNDAAQTSKAFVHNPFANAQYVANGWTTMHRTGDVGQLQDDGSLIFLHRKAGNTTVKLRGLRIDLTDIESTMVNTSDGVLNAVIVTLREGDPDYLVAHVTFDQLQKPSNPDSFLGHLLGRLPLPQYMIPVLALPLDRLPLTAHAKVDRKAVQKLLIHQKIRSKIQSDVQMTKTMVQLRQLWREILGKTNEELGLAISASTNFFMVGGNSLLVVRLQARIRQVFNVTIHLADLLRESTLEQIARKVEEATSIRVIDWDEETKLPLITDDLGQGQRRQQKGSATILVTGSTGDLAKRVLPVLQANPLVDQIICIAVRHEKTGASRSTLQGVKIVQYAGDLTSPRLGLTLEQFYTLSNDVDAILHLGASRSFWDNYNVLRSSNVQPIRELVQLAGPHRIPIHFVSTLRVLPEEVVKSAISGELPSAATYKSPLDGSDGYVASKWAGERILERASTDLGIPTFVHRLLPTDSLSSQSSKTAVLDEITRCVDLIGVMPDFAGWEGHIDLSPGEVIARQLSESLILSAGSQIVSAQVGSQGGTHISSYRSSIIVSVNEIKIYLEEKRGSRGLERMQILKWMGSIKAAGFLYVIATVDVSITDGRSGEKLRILR